MRRIQLLGLNIEEIRNILDGEKPYVAEQIFGFLHDGKRFDEMSSLRKDLRAKLIADYDDIPVKIIETFTGKSGTKKYLFSLADGNLIEGVFMPHDYGNTLCLSTQIGCRMGCAFCASGLDGLLRNLTPGEMLGQVIACNRQKGGTAKNRTVTNLVLMGSGEPMDNYDNVIKFLSLVTDPKGINISVRNISISTSGIADKMRDFALSGYPVTLSISLHSPFDAERTKLMPVNKKWNIAEVISSAKFYFEKTGRRVIYEYTLIAGENDSEACASELARITRGFPSHINLIRLNEIKDHNTLKAPTEDAAKKFLDKLTGMGVSATIRRSLGGDIEGACGQLRRRYMETK